MVTSHSNVEIRTAVSIRVRDGVRLSATLYLPENHTRAPCIVTLTPYLADTYHERGRYFAAHGMPFVIVDVRGRGNSEGVFRPMIQESADGFDVVEWLSAQTYCDGRVAMWGGSYSGYGQWVTAKERPPHLATIVPTAASFPGLDFPMRNNIFYPYVLQWLTLTSGRSSQFRMFADNSYWAHIYREWYQSGESFQDLGLRLDDSLLFNEWLTHPERDTYWDAYNPTAREYSQVEIPILTITGSYDDDQFGALTHYREHLRNAPEAARARHYLVIGPWDHSGTATPKTHFGGLQLGSGSLLDVSALHLDWYIWTMQNGPQPSFLKKRVAYYVMGAERWRYADALETVTARHERYFLDSNGTADDVFTSGFLQPYPGKGRPDGYTYDPADIRGLEVDAEARVAVGSLVNQSLILALSGRQFVYHSPPFAEDCEISGFFRLTAWIAIDCPDTDLYVSVHEIALDGLSIRLSTDALRARYREGLRVPKLIQTREPLRYDFERFTFVSRQVTRGHRLRLVIAPLGRIIDSNFVQKNYNAGGIVAQECSKDARPVTVRLFHDETHRSALFVPIGRSGTLGD